MDSVSDFRAGVLGISKGGIPVEAIDALALDLTSHLIGLDAELEAIFADAISSPVYQPCDYDFTALVPATADYIAKEWGTGPAIAIKQIAAKCFALAIEITREAA